MQKLVWRCVYPSSATDSSLNWFTLHRSAPKRRKNAMGIDHAPDVTGWEWIAWKTLTGANAVAGLKRIAMTPVCRLQFRILHLLASRPQCHRRTHTMRNISPNMQQSERERQLLCMQALSSSNCRCMAWLACLRLQQLQCSSSTACQSRTFSAYNPHMLAAKNTMRNNNTPEVTMATKQVRPHPHTHQS